MQEAANKQKRITLKTLHEMLNGMSVELAEKVHLRRVSASVGILRSISMMRMATSQIPLIWCQEVRS